MDWHTQFIRSFFIGFDQIFLKFKFNLDYLLWLNDQSLDPHTYRHTSNRSCSENLEIINLFTLLAISQSNDKNKIHLHNLHEIFYKLVKFLYTFPLRINRPTRYCYPFCLYVFQKWENHYLLGGVKIPPTPLTLVLIC